MSKMYYLFNKEKLDPNKKNLFVFLLDATLKKEIYAVTYSYVFNTMKVLNQDFNLIIISKNGGYKWTNDYINHPEFGNYAYLCFDKERKYGSTNAKQMPHDKKVEYILETFKELEENEKDIFANLAGTISSQFIIPSLDINFEIVSEDPVLIAKREKAIAKVQKGMLNHSLVSHCAFIHKPLGFPLEFLFYLMENYKDSWHYSFCHDTGSAWLPFNKNYNPLTKNVKCFYFIDDKRGIRDFTKFPLTELQDFYGKEYHTNEYYDEALANKSHDFVFGGLFPFEIDYRVNAWYRFFDKLNVDATIRTQTNGKPAVVTAKKSLLKVEDQKLPKKYQNNNQIESFVNDILANKYVTKTLPYAQYNETLRDYMFTIILKCYYGKYDSLNFRVINSLYFGTIPLIDNQYDIDDLQIPAELKTHIQVHNHEDIEEKVEYYKNHPDEYRDLFYSLYNYYLDSKFFTSQYYDNEFKQYFKELYK